MVAAGSAVTVPYPEDGPELPERGPSEMPRAPVPRPRRTVCRLCGVPVGAGYVHHDAVGPLCRRCWACGRPAGEECRG